MQQADIDVYGFATSTIEFWFCAVVRSAILSGAVIGRLCNKTDSQQRLQYTWPASTIIAVLMTMFSVVKMLAYTEVNSPSALFWCQFAWMLIASVSFHAGFVTLRRIRNVDPIIVNSSINCENDEQQPLLPGQSTGEISSETTNQKHMSTVFRLLSYSKPDAHLIIIAFIFMVISAVCKYYRCTYSCRFIVSFCVGFCLNDQFFNGDSILWHGNVMVKALDLRSTGGLRFDSRTVDFCVCKHFHHGHVTNLGKLFTHMCLCHQAV